MPRPSRTLTPELLRTFVLLVRRDGSVSATAEDLGINEASVSKRIKPLHEGDPVEVPRPWLQKHGKVFKLTDEGRRMLRPAEDQLARWGHFVEFVNRKELPRVDFACGLAAATDVGLRALKAFRRRSPEAHVRISTPRGDARIEGVALGAFDLALTDRDEATIFEVARRKLWVEPLYDDPFVLACSSRSKHARDLEALTGREMTTAKMLRLPLVLPEPDSGMRRQFERALHEKKLLDRLNVALEIGGWRSILAFVREGFGVGLLPRSIVGNKPAGLVVKEVPEDLASTNRVRLICRPNEESETGRELSEEGELFREALHEAVWAE